MWRCVERDGLHTRKKRKKWIQVSFFCPFDCLQLFIFCFLIQNKQILRSMELWASSECKKGHKIIVDHFQEGRLDFFSVESVFFCAIDLYMFFLLLVEGPIVWIRSDDGCVTWKIGKMCVLFLESYCFHTIYRITIRMSRTFV